MSVNHLKLTPSTLTPGVKNRCNGRPHRSDSVSAISSKLIFIFFLNPGTLSVRCQYLITFNLFFLISNSFIETCNSTLLVGCWAQIHMWCAVDRHIADRHLIVAGWLTCYLAQSTGSIGLCHCCGSVTAASSSNVRRSVISSRCCTCTVFVWSPYSCLLFAHSHFSRRRDQVTFSNRVAVFFFFLCLAHRLEPYSSI